MIKKKRKRNLKNYSYRDLLKDFKKSSNDKDIKALLRLRELLICCFSMKYNLDYLEVIYMLTGVHIKMNDIVELYYKLLTKYKHENKRIHKHIKQKENLSTFFGTLEE